MFFSLCNDMILIFVIEKWIDVKEQNLVLTVGLVHGIVRLTQMCYKIVQNCVKYKAISW